MRTFDIVVYLVCGPFLVYLASHWIREIQFYRRNGWNWDLDSGAPKIYFGSDGYIGTEMPARIRVHYHYPLAIAVCVLFLCIAIFQVPVET